MSNFNPINIITRIATNLISIQAAQNGNANGTGGANNALAAQNANLAQAFNNANMQSSENAGNAQLYFSATPLTLSVASEMKLTTIEIEQKANYVKDLLNLPREFTDLVEQITSNTTNSATLNQQMLTQLNKLFQNGKIDLSMLSVLLSENSKEAMQKLMMTIANVAKYGANDVSGLKDLMNLFAANTMASQDSQALKNLLLLYLPWLPLSVRNQDDLDFTIDIFDKIQGPDPDKDNPVESVTVLIETKNFSNVTGILEMNPLGQVDISIQAGKDFPHKRVIELLKEESSHNNVKSNIATEENKTVKENVDFSNNNVKITSESSISPKLMLMTQSLIKIIIQLDYEKTIIKKEEESNKQEGEV